MSVGQILFYDYEHCRTFIAERALELRSKAKGLESLALFRELYYSFSYEALENDSLTLGQFDTGLVYIFVPANLSLSEYPQGHEVVRAKAVELLKCTQPPVILELLTSQAAEPAVGPHARIQNWMRSEFLQDVLLPGRIQIQLYLDAGQLYSQLIVPQLESRGFVLIDDYVKAARQGSIRLKHISMPGKVIKLPWMAWIREMLGGGYSPVYLMACLSSYLQQLETATAASA